jgi:putative transposase
MPDYRRAHVRGGTYFFTVNTYRRQTFLTDADVRSALRETIGTLRLTHPFANELARTRALRADTLRADR